MPAKLGYWKLRGLAQHIRFLLEYTGTEYEEKIYEFGPSPDFDRSQWMDEKFKLGLDFPNLPYYVDGDHKLTQSNAILRYIARKNGLVGKTEEELIQQDVLENEALDLRMGFARLCYNPDFEKLKDEYMSDTVPQKLAQVSNFLGEKKWFMGDEIKFVDFAMYESLRAIKELTPSSFDNFENLKQFMANFESLEAIKNYMNSEKYISSPFNGPQALFSGK